jgi:WD40 repeat protein
VSPPAPALALSPDGSRFAVPIGAATVGVFATDTLKREVSFSIRPAGDPITALAWSPNGTVLAVGAQDGVVQVWGVDGTPQLERSLIGLTPLPGQPEAIQALAFSPDGGLLAGSDKSQTTTVGHTLVSPVAAMAIWHVDSGALVASPSDLGAGNGLNGADVVAFSPDGKLLAASLLTGGLRVFDPATGRVVRTLPDPGDASISLAFAPDGALAAGTLSGTVQMWNPVTGQRLAQPLLADSAPITSVAFDPTGRRFAVTGYGDGTVKVWFTKGLQQEGPRLATDPGATSAAAFDDTRSNMLLVVDDHGGAFTWPASPAGWEQRACALAGRNLTRAEWAQFVAGPRYTAVCP